MVSHYSYYLNLLFTVCFFAYLIPMVVPLAIAIFLGKYWVDKKMLFKSSFYNELNFEFSRHIVTLAQCSIPIYCLGFFIFSRYIPHEVTALSLLALLVGVAVGVYTLVWPNTLDNLVFSCWVKRPKLETASYGDCHF